jgi:Uma2 family endonuclease
MAETPRHRDNMIHTIVSLGYWFEDDPNVYVSGNMLVYYVPGDKRRHVSPDVFAVRGVPKLPERRYYLVWEERNPDMAIEMTSKSTQKEDLEEKFDLYQNVLRVSEYFLFDPFAEYLDPPLIGYRLHRRHYVRIKPVDGRLPSKVLGLHLERDGEDVRLYDPKTKRWLPTPPEEHEAVQRAEAERKRAEAERRRETKARRRAEAKREQAEAEADRLRRELEALRRRVPKQS